MKTIKRILCSVIEGRRMRIEKQVQRYVKQFRQY